MEQSSKKQASASATVSTLRPKPAVRLAIVRVRGKIRIRPEIKDTLTMLNLSTQNNMVILPNTSVYLGMLRRVKDYVTWGEISPETEQKAQARSEKKQRGDKVAIIYRLHPPRGGYDRKGIKQPFNLGGAVGYRGDKINILIERML